MALILMLSCSFFADADTQDNETCGTALLLAQSSNGTIDLTVDRQPKSENPEVEDSHARIVESGGRSNELAARARKLISEKRFDEGAEMLICAMKKKDGITWNSGMYSPGNLRGDLCFEELIHANRFTCLVKIIKQAMSLHQYESYDFNRDCYIEKCLLAELFLRQKNYLEARKWLHESISTLKSDQSICNDGARSYSMIHTEVMVPLANLCIAQKEYALAESVLQKISTVLAERVGPRHIAWVEIYDAESVLAQRQGNLQAAEKLARKAFGLEIWTYGPTSNVHGVRMALADVLKAEGKSKEADEISVTPPEPKPEPEDYSKLYPIGISGSFHSTEPKLYGNLAEEPLSVVQLRNAVVIHGEGGSQVKKAYDNLAKYYFQQHRLDECKRTVLQELKIIDEQYGTCLLPKFNCHLRMAEICAALNDKVGANKYVELLESTPMDKYFPVNRDMRVANMLWYVDKHDRAMQIAQNVETDLKKSAIRPGVMDPGECIEFMERANQLEDADSLRTLFGQPIAKTKSL